MAHSSSKQTRIPKATLLTILPAKKVYALIVTEKSMTSEHDH